MTVLHDRFDGDNDHLVRCIESLVALDLTGSLTPHGIGGHARELLCAAACRLPTAAGEGDRQRLILERAVDRMGWPEINAFHGELRRGQDIREDAGGYLMRAIRRLFGLPSPPPTVVNYQDAARALIAMAAGAQKR